MSDEPRDGTGEGADHGRNDGAGNEPEGSGPSLDPAHGPASPSDTATGDSTTSDTATGDPVTSDPANAESAPWERPRRWNQDPLDATRVDDLLARLNPDDAPPLEGRRRRRAADDAVPASELIAALSADAPTVAPATEEAVDLAVSPPVSPPVAPTEPNAPAPTESPDDATVFLGAGWAADGPEPAAPAAQHEPGVTTGQDDATVLLPPRIGPGDSAPIRDLGDDPRTDFIPKLTGGAADRAEADSIREALRRQSRIDTAAVAPGVAAGSGNPPPPHQGTHTLHPSGRPRRRHSGWLYAGRSVAALVAIITLLGVGVEWKIKDRADASIADHAVVALNTTDPNISSARTAPTVVTNSAGGTTTEAVKPATTYAPENILLLGSDTRSGANADVGADSSTDGTANSDTLMVAHISGDRQHVTILSIPRDTLIPAPTCKAWNSTTGKVSDQDFPVSPGQIFHINSAYSVGGPTCTVTAVQALTGLEITRMIGIDFSGFQAMVNALGGITVDVCRPIVDTVLGTVVPKAGTQVIEGFQALNLVRARDVIGDTESDLARIHRQQVVLSAILRQVTQAGTLLNPSKLDNFLQAFAKNTFTANVKLEDLVTLAGSMGTLDPAHVTFYTLPTVPSTTISGALDVDKAKASVVFDDLVNDLPLPGESAAATSTKTKTTPVTPAPTKAKAAPSLKLTVSPAKVNLEIYNVTGKANVAGEAQQKLNGVGFDVSDDQLYKPEGQTQSGTTVMYAPANRAAALTVAAAVPGSTLVVTPGLGSTVRLMLGSSYAGTVSAVTLGNQAPASLATAISTGSSVSTTSSAPATTTLASTALSSVNAGAGTCA